MWKNVQPLVFSELKKNVFLRTNELVHNQIRTIFVIKRVNPPKLHRKGEAPKNMKRKNYIYELVKNTETEKQPEIEVILKSYVEGLRNVGRKVSVSPNYAYNKLLLPGLAVYAYPANVKNFYIQTDTDKEYSFAYALYTVKSLQRVLLSVVMNMENPWTIKPWHIKASFRKCGYIVPESAITLPETPISGPDMNLEDKEFFITVTVSTLNCVKYVLLN